MYNFARLFWCWLRVVAPIHWIHQANHSKDSIPVELAVPKPHSSTPGHLVQYKQHHINKRKRHQHQLQHHQNQQQHQQNQHWREKEALACQLLVLLQMFMLKQSLHRRPGERRIRPLQWQVFQMSQGPQWQVSCLGDERKTLVLQADGPPSWVSRSGLFNFFNFFF